MRSRRILLPFATLAAVGVLAAGCSAAGSSVPVATTNVSMAKSYRFDPKTREMVLASWHPRHSVETVRAATGWGLRVADGCRETPTPTSAELEIVRACDPAGFWTR